EGMSNARRLMGLVLAGAMLAAACGGDDDSSSDDAGPPGSQEAATLHVPDDYPTVQKAVDAAEPGDLVLISPGTYQESVSVKTDNLTIRGLDRNEVILDGGFTMDNGFRVAGADGVAIENMTARNYTKNGFFWTDAKGYRGSYLTAYRNGD